MVRKVSLSHIDQEGKERISERTLPHGAAAIRVSDGAGKPVWAQNTE